MKNVFKEIARRLVSQLGFRLLTQPQTLAYLGPYQRAQQPAQRVATPAVPDATDPTKILFPPQETAIQPAYVWDCPGGTSGTAPARLLRNGSVQIGKNVLCTDYHADEALAGILKTSKRAAVTAAALVAPFSHVPHPDMIWGYYDFLLLVGAKLCRILAAVPELPAAEAVVAYPLFDTAYEREFLGVLGFRPEYVFDSRRYDVRAPRVLLANSGDWYYPSPADVGLLRERLAPLIREPAKKYARLYISRTGRRRIANEAALVALLRKYDFFVVEDRPRSLAEQLTLYHHASFILGPHGASFANIIWCQPGAHLYELFAPAYAPDYFLYLAGLTGLTYTASHQATAGDAQLPPSAQDIRVSIPDLERSLDALLK